MQQTPPPPGGGLSGVKKGPSFCRFSVSPSPLALLIRRLRSAFSFPPFYLSLSLSLSLSIYLSVTPRFFTLFFFSSMFLSFALLFTLVVPRLDRDRLNSARNSFNQTICSRPNYPPRFIQSLRMKFVDF